MAEDVWSPPAVELGPKHGAQLPGGLRYAASFISEEEEEANTSETETVRWGRQNRRR